MDKEEIDAGIYIQGLLAYICDTPALLSLLYDIDLLPEQTVNTADYRTTLAIADAWKNNEVSNEK
jgi:hypothetical protein